MSVIISEHCVTSATDPSAGFFFCFFFKKCFLLGLGAGLCVSIEWQCTGCFGIMGKSAAYLLNRLQYVEFICIHEKTVVLIFIL